MRHVSLSGYAGRLVLVTLVVASLARSGTAQEIDYAGTSAANFLKLPVGARSMALVGSDLTVAADATVLAWNVGMLPLVSGQNLTFSHIPWLVDTRVNYLGGVFHSAAGSIGVDLRFFDAGDIEETTLAEQDGTGRFISVNSFEVGAAYGRRLTDRFSFGVKLKLVQEKLANVSAGAVGVDIGAVFQTNLLRDARLAFALTNFGSKLRFEGRDLRVVFPVPDNPEGKSVPAQLQTGRWELPLGFRLGVSSDVIQSDQVGLRLNYSVFDSRDFGPRHLLGTEVLLLDILSLRGGYELSPGRNRFAAGAGISLDVFEGTPIRADYAFMEQPYFAGAQQVTVSVGF